MEEKKTNTEYEKLLLDFENNIFVGVKSALEHLKAENKLDIFAFAINISDDLVNIDCCANSNENINKVDKWSFYSFDIWLTGKGLSLDEAFFKAQDICEIFAENYCDFSTGENYDKVRRDVVNAIVRAMKKAKDSLDFDTSNITFFVTMMAECDADILTKMENLSAKQLNDENLYTNFENRFAK